MIMLEKWSSLSLFFFFFYSPSNQAEVVYHSGKMFACLPVVRLLWALKLI